MEGSLGIDIAKKSFECQAIKRDDQQQEAGFENNLKGFEQLHQWLLSQGIEKVHACMEATNIYWEELAHYLVEQGHQVSVVNPVRIKGFAQSQLRRNKTDQIDCRVIAQFCAQTKPALWEPPTPQQRQLRAWVRHREALVKTRTQQLNRLDSCADEVVIVSLQSLIASIEQQLKAIEGQIDQLISQSPSLQLAYTLLLSIKGFGSVTVIKLLAEFYDLAAYRSARTAAADAGLTPSHYQSGTSVRRRPRLCKIGKQSVRAALYWPAITAIRFNPVVKDLADRLRARGKPSKVIIGAAMRKLLHIAYGVLKNQSPFDPAYAP